MFYKGEKEDRSMELSTQCFHLLKKDLLICLRPVKFVISCQFKFPMIDEIGFGINSEPFPFDKKTTKGK